MHERTKKEGMLFNFSNPISCMNDLHPRNSHVQVVLKIDSVNTIEVFSNLTLLETNGIKCSFHSFTTKAASFNN